MKVFENIFLVGAKYELENLFLGINLVNYKPKISPFFKFLVTENKQNLIIITGFSKTNASAGAQFLLNNFVSKRYINLGLVGAINPNLNIGDVVQIKECRFYDVDFTAFNYQFGQIPSTNVCVYKLNKIPKINIPMVKLISGDRFVTDKSIFPNEIVKYGPDCVEVEMTSIAHVFYINGRLDKLSSIRTVSDRADNKANKDFYNNPRKLFGLTNKLIKKLINEI